MPKIFVDEKEVEAQEGTSIFLAAKQAGIPIPHLCFHPAFPPEGTCRICLVEIQGLPKLELACSTVIKDGMKVSTKSEKVVEARKGVLEFLLAEHPLDCPICDQAGDCKLQDYYEEYGFFESQFKETKEKREKRVELGKNLTHDQERCVLCRRCVRFLVDITKTGELGVFERGIHTEVNILDAAPVDNNYSGNLAQLCPVGAITDTDFRFKTRNWFLKGGDSICPLCSRGCNIVIQSLQGFHRFPVPKRVLRIKSREKQEVNGFWICDKGRYEYSYLEDGRHEHILSKNGGDKEAHNWEDALSALAEKIRELHLAEKTSRIALILSSWLTNEELFIIKKLFIDALQVEKIFFTDLPDGEADELLLTSERTPNKKGVLELGFDYKPLNLAALKKDTDLLLIFNSFIHEEPNLENIKAALDKIETKALFTSYSSELVANVDMAFPVGLIAEKEGSLTNIDGIVQKFPQALDAPGECLPEWEVLVGLARKVGINFKFYNQFSSPEIIFQKMGEEFSFFRK